MNKSLHILFALRSDYKENPGGDTIQMETWNSSLKHLGYEIILSSDYKDESVWEQCDLIFIWHLERVHESFPWWKRAKEKNIPIVLIPTYWHVGKRRIGYALLKQIELWIRVFICGIPAMLFSSWKRCRMKMLTESSLLIANSNAERDLLIREGAKAEKLAVVPNVAAQDRAEDEPLEWEQRKRIVYIGHFCPRKNQLALIKALKGFSVCITFIGGARPMHKHYMDRCIKAAAGQHEFLGKLSHEETLKMIRTSKYAISTSLSETPGIANLEAALSGCGLVLPALAPVEEYFEGCDVYYIDSGHIDPAALEQIFCQPPSPALRQRIKEKYTEAVLPEFWTGLNLERLSFKMTVSPGHGNMSE